MANNLKKLLSAALLIVFLGAEVLSVFSVFPVPAAAIEISGLDLIGNPAEGDVKETNCAFSAFSGACVPIHLVADTPRGNRNTKKNIWSGILYGMSIAIGKYIAHKVNQKFKINDYYGYNRSLADVVYRYRVLFDKYLDPNTRKLVDIGYDQVFRGGVNYQRVVGDLVQIANQQPVIKNLPKVTPQPLGVDDSALYRDPGIYPKLAFLGAQETPGSLYFKYQGAAIATKGQAQASANEEIGSSQGYKSSRAKEDLDKLTRAKDDAFYRNAATPGTPWAAIILPTTGQIRTPGAYAGRVVEQAIQKLLNRDWQNTNLTAAYAAEIALGFFFANLDAGVFGGKKDANYSGQTQVSGNENQGEIFYQDPSVRTDTGAQTDNPQSSGGVGGSLPPDCNTTLVNGHYTQYVLPGSADQPSGNCVPVVPGGPPPAGGNPPLGNSPLTADLTANGTSSTLSVPAGSLVTLAWTCVNATSAFVSNIGNVPPSSGSQSVTVDTSTSYTLTCGDGTSIAIASVTVSVTGGTGGGGGGPDSTPPSAPGSVSATYFSDLAGQRVLVSWTAATDNAQVRDYGVNRDGNSIALGISGFSYGDQNPASGDYQYCVYATDQSGNTGPSGCASVTVP